MQTPDTLKEQISQLNTRVTGAEKRMDQIVGEFGEMLDMIAALVEVYYSGDQQLMVLRIERAERLLARLRETYG